MGVDPVEIWIQFSFRKTLPEAKMIKINLLRGTMLISRILEPPQLCVLIRDLF